MAQKAKESIRPRSITLDKKRQPNISELMALINTIDNVAVQEKGHLLQIEFPEKKMELLSVKKPILGKSFPIFRKRKTIIFSKKSEEIRIPGQYSAVIVK